MHAIRVANTSQIFDSRGERVCVTEWFNTYITGVSVLLTVINNKKLLSCTYGVVWLVPFLHDFFWLLNLGLFSLFH